MLAAFERLSFSYAGDVLLEDANWQINPGERVGLVGPNGYGKSTVLALLSGELEPQSGRVIRLTGLSMELLHQEQADDSTATLRQSLLESFREVTELKKTIEQLTEAVARGDDDPELLAKLGEAQHRFEHLGGYGLESRVDEVTAELGFSPQDLDRPMSDFSGGERCRVALVKVLLRQPDLLLLDEPTNHLDIAATENLERLLVAYPGAVVVVSHDRAFLDAVCTKMAEVVGGKIETFRGNFTEYKKQRAERIEALAQLIAKQKAAIARLEDYIAKNQAGQKARQARSKKKVLDRIEVIEIPPDPWIKAEDLKLTYQTPDRPGGKDVLRAQNLSVGYDPKQPVIRDLDLNIYRGDRLGIIGPNGTGKSTLLRVLVGRQQPLSGKLVLGSGLSIGYFDQTRTDIDPNHTLVDEIRAARGEIAVETARDILGRLRFSGDDVFRPVSSLSGGEKNRLALGKLSLRPWHMLAFDEPTNHLDIPARQALERSLLAYDGTLLVVSHDRYFLDRLVTKLMAIDPKGNVEIYHGNYSEFRRSSQGRSWLERTTGRGWSTKAAAAIDHDDRAPTDRQRDEAQDKARRMAERQARKERKRARERLSRAKSGIEEEIETLEAEMAEIDTRLTEPDLPWEEIESLSKRRGEIESRLEELLEQWEEISEQLEALEEETSA